MLIYYLKAQYGKEINIFSPCELIINSFKGFESCIKQRFNLNENEMEEVRKTDDYGQLDKYKELWGIIETSHLIENVETAEAFLKNLKRCEVNIIFSTSESNDYSIEYFLDVNLKGVRLDTEDIFKGYLFAQDSSKEIYENWKVLKQQAIKLKQSRVNYSLMKLFEHYFYCDLFTDERYTSISFNEQFILDKEVVINGVPHYVGEHLIKLIRNKTYMLKATNKIIEFMKLVIDIVTSESPTATFKDAFKANIDHNEIVIIHNLMKKILLDDDVVPKVIIMKYVMSTILSNEEVEKRDYKKIYGVYLIAVLFIVFENQKNAHSMYKIVKTKEWYKNLIKEVKNYFTGSEISERKIVAQYKYTVGCEEYENQMFRCKSLATIYNFLEIKNDLVTPTDYNKLQEFLKNDKKYCIEHFIINKSKMCKIQVKDKVIEYRYPRGIVKYMNSLFNFIFISEEDNNIKLNDQCLNDKLEEINKIKKECAYSKMVISLIRKTISKSFPTVSLLEENDAIRQLDYYFTVEFKKQYSVYARLVIEKITEHFYGKLNNK